MMFNMDGDAFIVNACWKVASLNMDYIAIGRCSLSPLAPMHLGGIRKGRPIVPAVGHNHQVGGHPSMLYHNQSRWIIGPQA